MMMADHVEVEVLDDSFSVNLLHIIKTSGKNNIYDSNTITMDI